MRSCNATCVRFWAVANSNLTVRTVAGMLKQFVRIFTKDEGILRRSTSKLSITMLAATLLVVGATFLTAEHRPVQAALCGDAHNWRVFTPPSSDPGIPRHEFLGPPIIHDGVTSAYQYAGARSVLGDEFHGDLRLGHAPESTSEHASCEPD